MRILYNILFLFFFVLSSPYYFLKMWRRGNWQAGFRQRFGHYDANIQRALAGRRVLWMHAVSVGEMNVCVQVIRELEPLLDGFKIVVSTTTTTGMGELRKKLPGHIESIYYPIDGRNFVRRAFDAIRPDAIILVESEIWPNFIWQARDRETPLMLINARLSHRSYPRYRRLTAIFRPLFAAFGAVGTQNEEDAAKLRELGCNPSAIRVVGNLKFDAAQPDDKNPLDVITLLDRAGAAPDSQLLVAGSTHAGEEELLADQFLRLRERHPKLFLVLVPRHFERAKSVADALAKLGIKYQLRSELKDGARRKPGETQCLLVDSTGELKQFYRHATVVFIGKSLAATGGQNPLEPAALGKAVVFGPNMQNFTDIVSILLNGGAAIQVGDAVGLERTLDELLSNSDRREQLGSKAAQVVRENQGAVGRTVDMIIGTLAARGIRAEKNEGAEKPAPR